MLDSQQRMAEELEDKMRETKREFEAKQAEVTART
mgnify:CR=1 FL=1